MVKSVLSRTAGLYELLVRYFGMSGKIFLCLLQFMHDLGCNPLR